MFAQPVDPLPAAVLVDDVRHQNTLSRQRSMPLGIGGRGVRRTGIQNGARPQVLPAFSATSFASLTVPSSPQSTPPQSPFRPRSAHSFSAGSHSSARLSSPSTSDSGEPPFAAASAAQLPSPSATPSHCVRRNSSVRASTLPTIAEKNSSPASEALKARLHSMNVRHWDGSSRTNSSWDALHKVNWPSNGFSTHI